MSIQSIRKEQDKTTGIHREQTSFLRSQTVLFQSRKKWGMIYALATVAGLFCIPGGMVAASSEMDPLVLISRTLPLPIASLLIIVGMYVLNDLIDADLDRANGKKRPIPTGEVSKRQAWTFIIMANGTGLLLTALTFNPLSIIIASLVAAIGLMYSARRIALKDRFVIKTLAIATAIILCAVLGTTSTFGLNSADTSFVLIYAALLLGSMVFITSPFNDMGDIAGDKAVGRRTIPIVIGRENTVKMGIALAFGMIIFSWLFFELSEVSLYMVAGVSLVATFTALSMTRTLKRLGDTEYVRGQHKKSLPLHIMLQSAIMVGMLLI